MHRDLYYNVQSMTPDEGHITLIVSEEPAQKEFNLVNLVCVCEVILNDVDIKYCYFVDEWLVQFESA